MKNLLKKITFILTIIFLFAPFSFASADVRTPLEEDISDYVFYVDFIDGKPQASTDTNIPYFIIPVLEHAPLLPSGEFRGDIISGKGKLLTSFWFNTPETIIATLNKSRAEVRAPYFANADHANFYAKTGAKPLFTISLKGSSFCNENNKCDVGVGENYANCSSDCAAPVTITQEEVFPSLSDTTTRLEASSTTEDPQSAVETSTSIVPEEISSERTSKNNIIPLTIGVFLVLLSIIGFITWKRIGRSGVL